MKISVCSLCRDHNAKERMYNSFITCFPDDAEIILIDNSSENIDCYHAIQKFIQQSKGEYILICHDDVSFNNVKRDLFIKEIKKISNINANASLFGVAGLSIDQHRRVGHFYDARGEHNYGFHKGGEVESLDECLLVIKNGMGINVSDELKGYHFYGTDLCVNAREKGLSCYVIDFPVTHYSTGNINEDFFEARDRFEMHLHNKGLNQFIFTTCTVLYGGCNKLKQSWSLALSLVLIESANHKDLSSARKCIFYRAEKRCGKPLFQFLLYIIRMRFRTKKQYRKFKSDFLWWRNNWRSRVSF